MELKVEQLSNQVFSFFWEDPMHFTLVEIAIPDLTKLEYSVWGDWGPMYTFGLNELHKVGIQYNGVSFESSQVQLKVESPFFARERDHHPFYLIIEDPKRDVDFHLYLTKTYELGKAQVRRTRDDVMLFETNCAPYDFRQVI